MSRRLLAGVVYASSIFEISTIIFAARRTQQFYPLWGLFALFVLTKFAVKYVYLLRHAHHEKLD